MTLTVALQELFQFLSDRGHSVPDLQVAIVELCARDLLPSGQYVVRHEMIRSVDAYGGRFKELQRFGFAWLNLTCIGVIDKRLIVGVELPSSPSGAAKTSTNFSGPAKRILDAGWNATSVIRVE